MGDEEDSERLLAGKWHDPGQVPRFCWDPVSHLQNRLSGPLLWTAVSGAGRASPVGPGGWYMQAGRPPSWFCGCSLSAVGLWARLL